MRRQRSMKKPSAAVGEKQPQTEAGAPILRNNNMENFILLLLSSE